MATIATLTVRISAQLAEFQKSFDTANKTVKKFADDFEGSATRAAAVGTFFGTVAADMAQKFAGAVVSIAKDAVRLSAEFNNAFTGLSSVASAFGHDVGQVKAAAQALSADGLVPVASSATALKNLLSTGFGLPEAIKLLNVAKDSAAFNRQGFLSMGEAVERFTQGIKFNNSALTDSTGLGKNLSQVMKDAGFGIDAASRAASDAGVRQAILNGFLREGAVFAGDAARAANTYTGQLTAMQTAYKTLLATWGDAITQNQTLTTAFGAVGEALRGMTDGAAQNHTAFKLVSDAVVFAVKAFAGLVTALDYVQAGILTTQRALLVLVVAFDQVILKTYENIKATTELAKKLSPFGNAKADEEIARATERINHLKNEINSAKLAFADSEARQRSYSASLQGINAKASALADELAKTRGQVVELGAAGARTAGATGLAAGLDKSTKAAKTLGISFEKLTKNAAALDKTYGKLSDNFATFADARHERTFERLQAGMHASAVTMVELAQTLKKLDDGFSDFANQRFERTFDQLADGMANEVPEIVAKMTNPLKGAFLEMGLELPAAIAAGMQQGGALGAFVSVAALAGSKFRTAFSAELAKVNGDFSKLSKGSQIAGFGAAAAESFVSGFQSGLQGGSIGGALTSVASGFLSGFTATSNPYVGIATAGLALAGYLIGAAKEAKAAAAQLELEMGNLARQFGGILELKKTAERAGLQTSRTNPRTGVTETVGASASIDNIFKADNAIEFNKRVAQLNDALKEYEARLKAIDKATAGVNARTALFAQQFVPLLTQKATATEKGDTQGAADAAAAIRELAQRTQPEFERLGLFVQGTFAAIVRETGSAIGAITALAPAFDVLKKGVGEFGLTSTAAIDGLLSMFSLVNDAITGPLLKNIDATGQILSGLFDAKALNPELFQALATDIGQSLQAIEDQGGDMAKALALSQPVLQTLWEAQQTYGRVTDDTTQKILDQAEQQGLVGAQFKDTNEKILDILLAIGNVLGAVIPESLRKTAAAAQTTAGDMDRSFQTFAENTKRNVTRSFNDGFLTAEQRAAAAALRIQNQLNGIKAPDLTIDVDFNVADLNFDVDSSRIWQGAPQMATGGVVRRPTLALIGEAGPEAVVPLAQWNTRRGSNADAPRLVFGPGAVVLQGIDGPSIKAMVDSGAFTEAVEAQIRQNAGGLGTAVRQAVRV